MNYNNLSLDTALSREFSKMGMTVKGLITCSYYMVRVRVRIRVCLRVTCM